MTRVVLKREQLAPVCACCGSFNSVTLGLQEIKVLICLLAADQWLDLYAIQRVTGVSLRMVRRTVRERVPHLFRYVAAPRGGKERSRVRINQAGEQVARAQLFWMPPDKRAQLEHLQELQL